MIIIVQNIKASLRNARKNAVMSFAKLFGLSISFAVMLIAAGYVIYETSFDKFVPDHKQIYRCLMQGAFNNQDADFAVTSPEMANAIVSKIPEITEAVRIFYRGEHAVFNENEIYSSGSFYLADHNFFTFFSVPIITEMDNPLVSQNNITISNNLAFTLFGSANAALGESVEIGGDKYTVTGIFNDLPKNFHLRMDIIGSLQLLDPDEAGWGEQSYYTYFKTTSPDVTTEELNFKITKTVFSYPHFDVDVANAKTIEDFMLDPGNYLLFTAEHLTDIRFSNHKFDCAETSNKTYLYGAIFLAILVLVISSANFINLTIASISTRYKEIGIKKTTGAGTRDIVWCFITDLTLHFLVGFVLAIYIYHLAKHRILEYIGIDIVLSNKVLYATIGIVFIGLLIISIASHIIPVVLMAKTKSLNLIKNEKPIKNGISGRSVFLLLQFIIAGLIILCSFIVNKQINYMVSKDRGYDSENVIILDLWELNRDSRRSFIEELKSYSSIQSVATSSEYFGRDIGMTDAYFEQKAEGTYFHTTRLSVDAEFLKTFNLNLVQGRWFDKSKKTDSDALVLNEAAVKLYSGNESLLGKTVLLGHTNSYEVIGVVKDFNFRSLHHVIQPLVIRLVDNSGIVYVKVNGNQIAEALGVIRNQWDQFNIPIPYTYTFHNEVVARHYAKDQQAKRLLLVLTFIAISIACVGLYAISYFSIVRRTKEIGIRKVNGAKIWQVMLMLNMDFVKWVAIAFVIATPIAYFAMDKWLQNFAYRTPLSWWVFALAGLLALVIALLTVSWQSWLAARRNPVEALRYE